MTATALGGTHEAWLAAGGAGHKAPRQLAGGLGASVGYRHHWQGLAAHAELGGLVMTVPSVCLTVGIERPLRDEGAWRPALGLEATATWGRIRQLTADQPLPIPGPATSVHLAARPLAFQFDGSTVSVLELAYGRAVEAPLESHAGRVTLLAVGRQW